MIKILIYPYYPPVIQHGVLENGAYIGNVPQKTPVHRRFSTAMFDDQREKEMMENTQRCSDISSFKSEDSEFEAENGGIQRETCI